jgi:hypothetical protein
VAGSDDGYGIRLVKPGEIQEVRVLVKIEGGVIAANDLDCGRDDRDRVIAELLGEAATAVGISV